MKKVVLRLSVLLFLYSCNSSKLQKIQANKDDFPVSCANVYDIISTNWYKHKHNSCHLETFNIQQFYFENKPCLESLTKEQVIKLFGNPDLVEFPELFGYVVNKDCTDKSLLSYYLLQFYFVSGNKNKVEILIVNTTS